MRLVAWNIRAGGGKRWREIAAQLERWGTDIVGLSEFRATEPSLQLAQFLRDLGLEHQLTTASATHPGRNALLLASRWPLRRVRVRHSPRETARWVTAEVMTDPRFTVAVMHIPNMVTGRKPTYLESVERVAKFWRRGPAVFMGDTNCGWPVIDEERPVFNRATERWLDSLAAMGWRDGFRYQQPEARFYTWYSPNAGNGFRLDQAFLNRGLLPRLQRAHYEWGASQNGMSPRREELSDHAALLLDLE